MAIKTDNYFVIQNLGAIDRIVRVVIGTLMLAVPYLTLSQPGGEMVWWFSASMMLSVYPLLTAFCGYDPLYQSAHIKSCSVGDGRNQCGTFPYEVDALLGHKPVPEDHVSHELGHSHHNKAA
jgi:hypothetical protein